MNVKRRNAMVWLATQFIAIAAIAPLQHVRAGDPQKTRQAGVAGSFYPADPKVLNAMMDEMLAKAAQAQIKDPILAVVAPHAGYQYSGPVAAYTYAELKGRKFSRVVVIAPSHFESFDFTSVYEGGAYATPLGTVPVDKAFAGQLAKMSSTIKLSSRGHDATSAGAEHAIEVQLPWLQHVLGEFTLVPGYGRPKLREQPRAGRGAGQDDSGQRQGRRDADRRQFRSFALPHIRRCGEDRPQDPQRAGRMGLLQHVAQLPDAHLGGLRRSAHCGRHDCRRAHGRKTGHGAEVCQLRRCDGRPLARGGLQRGRLCESEERSGGGSSILIV